MASIGLDIDGCFADFNTGYGKALIEVGGNRFPEGYNFRQPPVWYWERDAGYPPEVEKEVWTNHILAPEKNFWKKLDPLPGAREALPILDKLSREGNNVYFLTHRVGVTAKRQTEEWLYEHGMSYPTVILTGADKIPIIRALKIEFFLDDKVETMNEVGRVAEEERWMGHYLLFDAAYNREGRNGKVMVVRTLREALERAQLWR